MNNTIISALLCFTSATLLVGSALASDEPTINSMPHPTSRLSGTTKQAAKPRSVEVKPSDQGKLKITDPAAIEQEAASLAPAYETLRQARARLQSGDLLSAEALCLQAATAFKGRATEAQAQQLLGEIYLTSGQNARALQAFYASGNNSNNQQLRLDAALAYSRLGNYASAKRFYSDNIITQYHVAGHDIDPQDLPGTDSPQAMEASILLARGIDAFFGARKEDAIVDFVAADRLIPNNPLVHYFWGYALVHSSRGPEAVEHFQIAAEYGHGALAKDAGERLQSTQAEAQLQAKHTKGVR